MDRLHTWLEAQFAERKTEPNSGLGQAIGICCGTGSLDVVPSQSGAPLDNNVAERP